jgi:hypothetical protein
MPTNQTKVLNDSETSISQALSNRGGSVLYTGMNSKGEYFIGKKKFNASTGEEIPTGGSSAIVSENLAKSSFDNLYVNNLFVNTKLDASTASVSAGSLDVTGISTFQNNIILSNPNTYIRWDANTDYAFIRFNSTSDTNSQLEIAVGDNGNGTGIGTADSIVVNQYAPNGAIARTLQLLNGSGNTVIPGNTTVSGTLTVTGTTTLNSTVTSSAVVNITNNTASTSKTTGALVVTGGVGISGALYVGGDITAFDTSDQRLKDNITPIPNALDKVISISGNTFDWNEKSEKDGSDVGVIAQEILEVLPEAVTTRDNGYLAVRYEKIIPLLIEAIKELKVEINELKGVK